MEDSKENANNNKDEIEKQEKNENIVSGITNIKRNIFESINSIMKDVPSIGKSKKNEQQKFMYRGIDDVINAIQPLLAENKVFIVPEILEQQREERTTKTGGNLIYSICKIRYRFYAEDGSFIDAITIGEGMDSGDKATNKAMAIAMKYALFQVFCIPTEEMKDPDSETPEESKPKGKATKNTSDPNAKVSEAQAISIYALMNRKGLDIITLLKKNYNITNTKDLTVAQFNSIFNKIKDLPDKKAQMQQTQETKQTGEQKQSQEIPQPQENAN